MLLMEETKRVPVKISLVPKSSCERCLLVSYQRLKWMAGSSQSHKLSWSYEYWISCILKLMAINQCYHVKMTKQAGQDTTNCLVWNATSLAGGVRSSFARKALFSAAATHWQKLWEEAEAPKCLPRCRISGLHEEVRSAAAL